MNYCLNKPQKVIFSRGRESHYLQFTPPLDGRFTWGIIYSKAQCKKQFTCKRGCSRCEHLSRHLHSEYLWGSVKLLVLIRCRVFEAVFFHQESKERRITCAVMSYPSDLKVLHKKSCLISYQLFHSLTPVDAVPSSLSPGVTQYQGKLLKWSGNQQQCDSVEWESMDNTELFWGCEWRCSQFEAPVGASDSAQAPLQLPI